MQTAAIDLVTATADYRRRARRIRASFRSDTGLRQRALGQLAVQQDSKPKAAEPTEKPIPNQARSIPLGRLHTTARRVPPSHQQSVISALELGFAEHANSKLQPFGFSYPDRVQLLDSAEKLGILRFRANLILALAEHHAPARRSAPPEVPGRSIAPSLLAILLLETIIVGGLVLLYTVI